MYEEIAPCTYLLPKTGRMLVPGFVIASEEMLKREEIQRSLEQVRNVATLPGIVGYSIAMPDVHWGYGFPIGGVAAMDVKEGVISPGGVGYDINCGVRLATIAKPFDSLTHKEKLLERLFALIPSGVGHGHQNTPLSDRDYRELCTKGAAWSIEQGYGFEEDLECMEGEGVVKGADFSFISKEALERGKKQLGSIGSGNHFVEIGKIEKVFLPEVAEEWKIQEGEIYILIHSGSRGFGHQICQDTLDQFIQKEIEGLVDKQLVYAPIQSDSGKRYISVMAAAANYAFNNRQRILHEVREAFFQAYGISPEEIRLLYDVCHNIAKLEEYEGRKVYVHRKGATRAFGPGHPELSPLFQKTGQPVMVPGDMGRASYILVGSGNALTWCSCCHGAGRLKSRIQSKKSWKGRDIYSYMEEQGVHVKASSYRTLAEEMPDAYKDVSQVVKVVEFANLSKKVAQLKPSLVIKG